MATYKALLLNSTTSPLSLTSLPIPTASPGSIVVKVLATYILPYHKSVLDGSLPYPLALPIVPGSSCIARVHSVGPDSTTLEPGTLVFCDQMVRARRGGQEHPHGSIWWHHEIDGRRVAQW